LYIQEYLVYDHFNVRSTMKAARCVMSLLMLLRMFHVQFSPPHFKFYLSLLHLSDLQLQTYVLMYLQMNEDSVLLVQ